MLAENVGRDNASEHISVLVVVGVILNIYQSLPVCVSKVGSVRGSKMDFILSKGVVDLLSVEA